MLIICRQLEINSTSFKDFIMHQSKIGKALIWLKENNQYYENIIIDQEILNFLSENDLITKMFSQLQNDQLIDEISVNEESELNKIIRNFVPSQTSTRREDVSINDTLDRIQTNDTPLL